MDNKPNTNRFMKICLITSVCRALTIVMAYNGIKDYNYPFFFTMFILLCFYFIDRAFIKNSKSTNYS